MPHEPQITMSVRLIPAVYSNIRVRITPGDPFASIALNRADIRFPEPFDDDGLTHACRDFIVHAVRSAIARDGHDRHINWPATPSWIPTS
jgi:hypothetical protein